MIILELAMPPSVNVYWRLPPGGGTKPYVSDAGMAYRRKVQGAALRLRSSGRLARTALSGRLRVGVVLCPPNRRKRDLDNVFKALLDSLTHAKVWADDEQIDDLRIVRGDIVKGGAVVVTIETIQLQAKAA